VRPKAQAPEVLRLRIGDWTGIPESGCRAEAAQGRTAGRIGRAVTVRTAAWRPAPVTLPGREAPEPRAGLPFTGHGTMATEGFAEERGLPAPRTVGAALPPVAAFGACMDRKRDGPPGHRTFRKGYACLMAVARGCRPMLGRSGDPPNADA